MRNKISSGGVQGTCNIICIYEQGSRDTLTVANVKVLA
jgi:hypothetical protein